MPANLSQQYRNAEKKYRNSASAEEELACLQLMLREIPKHKGTDKLQAELKRKISLTRKELECRSASPKPSGFRLPRQGAGRVVIVGGPNSGKSSLLNVLADGSAEVADFPYATRQPYPALMAYEEVRIQLVDTAPVSGQKLDPKTESLLRSADLVLLLIDLAGDDSIEFFFECFETIQESRTRLGSLSRLDEQDIGVTYTRTLLVWTQSDKRDAQSRRPLFEELIGLQLGALDFPGLEVSTRDTGSLAILKQAIFRSLDVVRIYTRDPSAKEPDLTDPFTLRRGSNVMDLASCVHEEVARNFHSARVWGEGKHDGTVVQANYILQDRDIVEIRTR